MSLWAVSMAPCGPRIRVRRRARRGYRINSGMLSQSTKRNIDITHFRQTFLVRKAAFVKVLVNVHCSISRLHLTDSVFMASLQYTRRKHRALVWQMVCNKGHNICAFVHAREITTCHRSQASCRPPVTRGSQISSLFPRARSRVLSEHFSFISLAWAHT